jgi:hypothetical protein
VYLKTYEEAACDVDPCTFRWVKSDLPSITAYSVDFDTTLNDYVLTLTGTGFDNVTIGDGVTELWVDGYLQPLISASSTQLQYQLTQMLFNYTLNIDLYLPIGIPDGIEDLKYVSGIAVEPKFLSLSPGVGSPAGTIIEAIVKGVGPNTAPVTLVTSTGTDICATVTIPTYGVVLCKTKSTVNLSAGDLIQVKIGTNAPVSCLGTSDQCTYTTSTNFPSVTSVAKTNAYDITITGTNFQSTTVDGFTPFVTFANVTASTLTVVSTT